MVYLISFLRGCSFVETKESSWRSVIFGGGAAGWWCFKVGVSFSLFMQSFALRLSVVPAVLTAVVATNNNTL